MWPWNRQWKQVTVLEANKLYKRNLFLVQQKCEVYKTADNEHNNYKVK